MQRNKIRDDAFYKSPGEMTTVKELRVVDELFQKNSSCFNKIALPIIPQLAH